MFCHVQTRWIFCHGKYSELSKSLGLVFVPLESFSFPTSFGVEYI